MGMSVASNGNIRDVSGRCLSEYRRCQRGRLLTTEALYDANSELTVEGDLPSPLAICLHEAPRSGILWTVFRSCLVGLPFDPLDGFGLDMSASLHRGPRDSGPSGVAYPDSRLRTRRNALRRVLRLLQ